MGTHLRRLLESLHEAGVQATVLKGPHLARWAYANPAHRTFTDIDLLVPHGDIEAALEVIAADPSVITIPPKTPKADKRNVSMGDESGIRFTLDLHWDLFSYTQLRGCAGGGTAWAWEHAEFKAQHTLGPLWELPVEAQLAFLCTHALLDHRFRLVLFRDLAEVSSRFAAWDQLVDFGRRWKLQSFTYFGLLVAERVADAALPVWILSSLRRPSIPTRSLELLLPRTDLTTFDERSPSAVNIGALMLHDSLPERYHLAFRAAQALPGYVKTAKASVHDRLAPVKVVYVGGSNRSGTTLVDLALGQAPGFVSCGELVNLWSRSLSGERLCGCGLDVRECPFWRSVAERAFGGWDQLDIDDLTKLSRSVNRLRYLPLIVAPWLWPPFARRLKRFEVVLTQLYRAIANVADADYVVDSSKAPAYRDHTESDAER